MDGCRVCLAEDADVFVSLFSKPEDVPIAEMMNEFTGLGIAKGDGLPRYICKECSEDIMKCYKLRRKCLDSDRQLRSALEKSREKMKMVELYLRNEISKEGSEKSSKTVDIPAPANKDVASDVVQGEESASANKEHANPEPSPVEVVEHVQHVQKKVEEIRPAENALSSIKLEAEVDLCDDEKLQESSDDEKEIEESVVEHEEVCQQKEVVQEEDAYDAAHNPPEPEEEIEYTEEYLETAVENTEEVQFTIDTVDEVEEEISIVANTESEYTIEESEIKFICCGCEMHFGSEDELKQHSMDEHEKMRLKTSAKPFECHVCFKRFLSIQRLNLHQTYVYRDKNHVCETCEAKFTCRGSLLNHMKTHAERTYVCEDCNKSFHTSSTLKSHRLLHTDSKQYKCTHPDCFKSFLRKSDLHIHLVSHSDERPYACELCSSRFKSKAHLVHHGKVHTGEKPYKCSHCDKAFGTYSAKKIHQLAHEGIHPYRCSFCDKTYQRNTKLQVHIRRIHTGERPFVCDLCELGFYQNWELTAHKKKIHQVEPAAGTVVDFNQEGEDDEEEMEECSSPETKPKRFKKEPAS